MSSPGDQGGYTLAEMLVALLIVGLAMGGVMQATALLSHLQRDAQARVQGFERGRELQQAFTTLLAGRGPFRSSSKALEGDADGFQFGCGEALCGAHLIGGRLELTSPTRSTIDLGRDFTGRFQYVGTSNAGDAWPSEGSVDQRLSAIELIAEGHDGGPIASARIWRQEEPGCQFDTIAKDCRRAAS